MEKLSTIQKREKLNEVYAIDEKGNGGANHIYGIGFDSGSKDKNNDVYLIDPTNPHQKFKGEDKPQIDVVLEFQNGPRHLYDSITGVTDQDLLEIVRHRLAGFNTGGLTTKENTMALTHVEEALLWLNKRTEDRIERNVLGTNKA